MEKLSIIMWSACGVLLVVLAALIWFSFKKKDIVVIIDRNNRWKMYKADLKGKSFVRVAGMEYPLVERCGLISAKGKTMYVFSEKKPQPMELNYNESKWLDSESLSAIINNKLVQQIVRPTDKLADMIIMLGAIGGIISAIAATVVLLIVTGVIKK